MRAQIFGDLAAIAEESGDRAEADELYRQAVALLEANYPGTAVLLNSKARLAGYLARSGQLTTAEAMFSDIVHSQPDTSNLPPSFANVLRPYVELLLKKGDDPKAARRNLRRDPADGPSWPRADPGGPCPRVDRRHRRSFPPLPPVGHPDPRRSSARRIELARLQDLAKPTPQETVRARVLRASLDHRRRSS